MPASGGPSTPSSPTRSTRTSSASRTAAWPSTCPTASTASSSTSTARRASGASTRPTASAPILAEGRPVVRETMDFDAFKAKYFRFWNVDDLPGDDTFDKYQKAYFHEKHVRRRGHRRPVEPRVPGRELGLLRLGRRDLPRGEGGRRAKRSSTTWKPGAGSTSTTTSSASCPRPPATRCGRPTTSGAVASSSSSATRCRTSSHNDTPVPDERSIGCSRRGVRGRIRAGDPRGLSRSATWARSTVERLRPDRTGGDDPRAAIDLGLSSPTGSAASPAEGASTRSARA